VEIPSVSPVNPRILKGAGGLNGAIGSGAGEADMSGAEVAGLALTAGLLGGLLGATTILLLTGAHLRRGARRERLLDGYARWLAAHYRVSRAAGSFVTAFRTLAAEPRDSRFSSLRCAEAQRTRAEWCEAVRALDLAEANLIAWDDGPLLRERLRRIQRVTVRHLRQAVEGDERAGDDLALHLRTTEEQVLAAVREAASRERVGAERWVRLWSAVLDRLERPARIDRGRSQRGG